MKRFLFGFLAIFFLFFNTLPYFHIMADTSMTDAQYKQVGAFALSSLITTGEATELDFSDYTSSDTDFLLALGELVVNGDPSGLVECGLDWLGGTIDDAYNSAIQSIRTWEYDNLPHSFYYWFIDQNPPYELSPAYDNIRDLSQPLRELLTPRSQSTPTPDPDYSYISNINNIYLYDYKLSSINTQIYTYQNPNYYTFAKGDYTKQSFIGINFNSLHVPNNLDPTSRDTLFCLNGISTIQINHTNGNNAFVTYSLSAPYQNGLIPYNYCGFYPSSVTNDNIIYSTNLRNARDITPYNTSSFSTLSSALSYIYQHYTNINLYVNGVAWVLMDSPTYPIVIPDRLTIWNNQPLQYEFPSGTYLKLPDLTNIITNAINNSRVVMWSDIADCFVDVNGQTAVAVTKIVRNDYDNLYMEQYPYPAILIGMTDNTKFDENLLVNSHGYLEPMVDVVENTIDILPSEIVGVLAIGAILTIFAVIINRLLE